MKTKPPVWLMEATGGKPTRFDLAVAKRLEAFESAAEYQFTTTDQLEKMKQEFITFLRQPRKGVTYGTVAAAHAASAVITNDRHEDVDRRTD